MAFVRSLADRHPVVAYTLARVLLLLAVLLPLALLGVRGLWLLVSAFLVSGALSLFLLNGLRSRFSGAVSGQFRRINERIDAATRAEDDEPSADQRQPQAQAEPGQQ